MSNNLNLSNPLHFSACAARNSQEPHTGKNVYGYECSPYVYILLWYNEMGVPFAGYIGSQYGRDCKPNDLFSTYFTSSKLVDWFIKQSGAPSFISIRKIFQGDDAGKAAFEYETKLLRKYKVRESTFWLNGHENDWMLSPENFRQTMIDRFGVDCATKHPMIKEKIKETNMVRYGVPCTFQIEEVKMRYRETMLGKYGVPWPMMSEDVKRKSRETCMAKYGQTHNQTPESLEKRKKTSLEKYGYEYHSQRESHRKYISEVAKEIRKRDKSLTCPHCGKTGKVQNMKRYHFEFCEMNPNRIDRNAKEVCPHCKQKVERNSRWHFDKCRSHPNYSPPQKKEPTICPHCGISCKSESNAKHYHMDNCPQKPGNENKPRISRKEVTCPHCGKVGKGGGMYRYHMDNCKLFPRLSEDEGV